MPPPAAGCDPLPGRGRNLLAGDARGLPRLGDDITWREAPATERTRLLVRGEVDFIVASYQITDEREADVDFTGPYLSARQDLLVCADDRAPDMTDLNDMTLCSVTGSTSAQVVQEDLAPGVELTECASYSECLTAMDRGQVDALTTDDSLLAGYASQGGNPGDYRLAGLELSTENLYGVGVPQGETELRDDIDAAIDQMIADGSWAKAAAANRTRSAAAR
ncbi:transporter substrate-binding domain-containing protein [Streptomyces sp. DSM 40750]|nr:transporter substrate-binding domain-containing protein [Streptomyces sp. DSM 40750]